MLAREVEVMTTDPETQESPRTRRARFKDWYWVKQYQLHMRTPWLVRHPSDREDLAISRRRDPEANQKTTPPPEEQITPIAFWLVEFYGPSEFANLAGALDRWESLQQPKTMRDSVSEWIRETRQHGYPAWRRLGLFVSKTSRASGDTVPCAPPEGIKYVSADLHSITASLTAIVYQFVLHETEHRALDNLLRRVYQTAVVTKTRVRRTTPVEMVKLRAVEEWTLEYRRRCERWIAREAAGAFTRASPNSQLPCCELLQLAHLLPFSNPKGPERGYARMLGLDNDLAAYSSDELPGFRLGEPIHGGRSRLSLILAFRPDDVPVDNLRRYGGTGPGQYLNYLHGRVESLLIRWALVRLVSAYQGVLGRSRDFFPGLQISSRGATRLLDFIARTLSVTGSLSSIRSDLETFADSPWWSDGLPSFVSVHDPMRGEVSAELRTRLKEALTHIAKDERILQRYLTEYASVFSASTSLRLQSHVRFLTWVMLFLTLASVMLGSVAIRDQLVAQRDTTTPPSAIQRSQP